MDIDLEKYANGEIGTRKHNLWNSAGSWPDDMKNPTQNPHGRPRNYFCPTVAGEIVAWEGEIGFLTRKRALEVATMFRDKCREMLQP
jgi:hypothetical protein